MATDVEFYDSGYERAVVGQRSPSPKARRMVARVGCRGAAAMFILMAALTGCGVYGTSTEARGGGGDGGGSSGSSFGPLTYRLPSDGAIVREPFVLAVEGSGIAMVEISLEGTSPARIYSPPFAVAVDPTELFPGNLGIQVVVDGFSRGQQDIRTIEVTIERPRPPLTEMMDAIATLPGGNWYEVPWSQLQDVQWVAPTHEEYRGSVGTIFASSGGAFDSKRNRLVVWGGGGSSWRNEIYAFDVDTLEWERITDPSPWPVGGEDNAFDQVAHPDSAPLSRHSYSYVEYVPDPVDRLVVLGGVVLGTAQALIRDENIYHFDFETRSWEIMGATNPYAFWGTHAAVDSSGTVWFHSAGSAANSRLLRYEPSNGSLTAAAPWGGGYQLERKAAIDTTRRRMIAVGVGATVAWDLENMHDAGGVVATSGATEIESVEGPGVEYHAATDRIVAWGGGSAVYTLDPDTGLWTRHETTGTVAPQGNGTQTFGRFRYCANYDIFVLVTDAAQNVFLYRLPD